MEQNNKKLKYIVAKTSKQKHTTTSRKTVRTLRRMHVFLNNMGIMTDGTICDRRRTASASTSLSMMAVGSKVMTLTLTRVASWRRRTMMTAVIITTNMTTPYILLLLLMSISMSMMSLFDFHVRALSTNHIVVPSIGDPGGGQT
jgi:hypothetical protein